MQALDDKRKQKEAGDFFMAGKTHFRNKDISSAGNDHDPHGLRTSPSFGFVG
jgi:hypothetical protein